MTNLVVGIDGSESAAQALRWASREAELHGWGVTAVLAWGLLNQHHPHGERAFDPDYDEQSATKALGAYVESALGPDAATSVLLRPWNDLPARALLDASTEASMLVVGGRGLGGFNGLLVGSVSYQCLHHARCPVAIIREGQRPSRSQRPERIVVGVDGSDAAHRALEWAVREAWLREASLEVVHAWQVVYAGGGAFGTLAVDPSIYREPAEVTLTSAMGSVDLSGVRGPVKRTLVQGSPGVALVDLAKGADLVVIGTRGLGGFAGLLMGSVATHVVHHAGCPVVVLPPEEPPHEHHR